MSTAHTASPRRWVTPFVVLLLLASALLVVGVVVEQGQTHTETSATPSATSGERHESTESGEVGEAGESGGHAEAGEPAQGTEAGAETHAPGTAEAGQDEAILGVNPESTPVVGVAVLLALILVAAVWWRPNRVVLALAVLYCLGAAALDVREVAHQMTEDQSGIAALATGVLLLHLVAAAVAVAAFIARRQGAQTGSAPAALA